MDPNPNKKGLWVFALVVLPSVLGLIVGLAWRSSQKESKVAYACGPPPVPASVSINSPTGSSIHRFTSVSSYRSVTFGFSATFSPGDSGIPPGADIVWDVTREYNYSTNRNGDTSVIKSFTTTSGQGSNQVFSTTQGGRITVTARVENSTAESWITCTTGPLYVTGDEIPNTTIQSYLQNQYDPETALGEHIENLADTDFDEDVLWDICQYESSTMQFYNNALYNYPDVTRFPYISNDSGGERGDDNDGSHVGLMQVSTTQYGLTAAWDWQANCRDGAEVFHEKLQIAIIEYWEEWHDDHPTLPEWTAQQIEDVAVGLYGPYSGSYWVPNGSYDGWVKTTDSNLEGYVDGVRGY